MFLDTKYLIQLLINIFHQHSIFELQIPVQLCELSHLLEDELPLALYLLALLEDLLDQVHVLLMHKVAPDVHLFRHRDSLRFRDLGSESVGGGFFGFVGFL